MNWILQRDLRGGAGMLKYSSDGHLLAATISGIRLPAGVSRVMNASVESFLTDHSGTFFDFTKPVDQEALVPPCSVSWRIFKNPVTLFIGGTAAVILELAEPAVCAGVWGHSSFRRDALGRLRRTGLAAMITVYGARVVAEAMIARIVRMHSSVRGTSANGVSYSANDPDLLAWVHATAAYSFANAYSRYAAELNEAQFGSFFREGAPIAGLYGARYSPASRAEMDEFLERMRPNLEPSPVIFEFLNIMRATPAFPRALRWMQSILVRAAVDLIPSPIRLQLGLSRLCLGKQERWVAKFAGAAADRVILPSNPAIQSCVRLGLPATFLYS
ncbi:MAG TPA: oxygenase MpaB family protein [Steroidobacteraceae bacterium]